MGVIRMSMTVDPPDFRRIEHLSGEVQAVVLDAADELTPVAKRLQQRKLTDDARAIEASIMSLKRSARLLAQLSKYAR